MEEKRTQKRIEKKLKAEVHTPDGMTYSSSVDISTGGIFISTPEPLQQNEEVMLAVKVSENVTVDIKGVIKWNRDETEDMKAGMGIQFKDLGAGDKEKILALLG